MATVSFSKELGTLIVTTVGEGKVYIFPRKAIYKEGDWVFLYASPASGWKFSRWSGDLIGIHRFALYIVK